MSDQAGGAPPENQNTGPWAEQLAQRFEDPEQRAAVDAFLRETVQPHVTKLEQRGAELQDAQRLYEDLSNNPAETYVAITAELFGDEAADKVLSALRTGEVKEVPDGEGGTEIEVAKGAELDPETREAIEWIKSQKQSNEYDTAVDAFLTAHAGDNIVKSLFHPFVAGAGGNLEAARQGYLEFAQQWAAANGGQAPTGEETATEPPPTLGTGGENAAAPPVQKEYRNLDEAMDDFFAEKKTAPPVVGSV